MTNSIFPRIFLIDPQLLRDFCQAVPQFRKMPRDAYTLIYLLESLVRTQIFILIIKIKRAITSRFRREAFLDLCLPSWRLLMNLGILGELIIIKSKAWSSPAAKMLHTMGVPLDVPSFWWNMLILSKTSSGFQEVHSGPPSLKWSGFWGTTQKFSDVLQIKPGCVSSIFTTYTGSKC